MFGKKPRSIQRCSLAAFALAAICVAGPQAREPREQEDAPGTSKKDLRVLVYYDMEGLSGQSDWRTASFAEKDYYPKGQEFLIGDVNAVVAGLAEAGASVIDVVDSHGSGSADPDLPPDRLDPRANTVSRSEPFHPYTDLVKPGAYDAVAVVGMHAKTSTRGFLAHTFDMGFNISLNGNWITETEFVAYSWGRVGVPVIFASGDDQLANDLKTMPWLEYVTVKRAKGTTTADLLPVERVHETLREAARRGLENRAHAKVMKLETPIRVVVRATPPASLAVLDGVPGVNYRDQTVTWNADNFEGTFAGLEALDRLATRPFESFVLEQFATVPNFDELERKGLEALLARYTEVEEGRWTPPPPGKPRAARDGRYYGDR